MSHDELPSPMMTIYNETADKLSRGMPISDDELRRFLGVTGLMQVQMQSQLWTQAELEKQIDERLKNRCASCPNSAQLAELVKKDAVEKETAPAEKLTFKQTMLEALAENMKTAIITAGIVVTLLGLSIIFTRQIAETTGLIQTTGQIAHGGSK